MFKYAIIKIDFVSFNRMLLFLLGNIYIYVCYKDIIELLSNSIQIIGIFAAIIIGLVVSKILSIKAEQDDLKIKISDG